MFGSHLEEEFANDISVAGSPRRGSGHWWTIILIISGIFLLILWANFSYIEETTTGQGKVVPSSQLQVVQTLEGGIIRSINVAEGDTVEKGQELAQIDDTGFSASLGELRQKQLAILVETMRLKAEAVGQTELTFPKLLMDAVPTSINAQKQVFALRRLQIDKEIDVLDSRLLQRQSELRELEARKTKLENTLEPLQEEVDLTKKMVSRGVVAKIDLLRLESRVAEQEGDLAIVLAAVPKVEASIDEANNQIASKQNNFLLAAREKLAPLEAELSVVKETMRAASDRVNRTLLRSPVNGIVNKVNVSTIGAVVSPGREVFEIVPIGDGLLIQARIRPQDVAFIKPNERASVKLTAYDYLIFGALEGKVKRISADTITDEQGESYYHVTVETERNYLGEEEGRYPIIPGMVATVDIQTGKKTVLTYLLKPILRARAEALRER